MLNEKNSGIIEPALTTSEDSKNQFGSANGQINKTSDIIVGSTVCVKTPPPEKPPRIKSEIQRTSNSSDNINEEEGTRAPSHKKNKIDSNLNRLDAFEVLSRSDISIASKEDFIYREHLEIPARLRKSSSTVSLLSRDHTLPIKSLPGPPIPERPLRPALSCYAEINSNLSVKSSDGRSTNRSHQRFGSRMARSSSRIFSACISGQKDLEEESSMKLRRSTSEGKVSKDKKNEARAVKSRSVHFDGNEDGKTPLAS